MDQIFYLITGLSAGFLSGLVGIGGGIIIIPVLVYFFKMSQQTAQGTTLAALVPPIGLFAAYIYHKNGHVNIPVASYICAGFVVGASLGAWLAGGFSNVMLRKMFALLLFAVSLHMFLSK